MLGPLAQILQTVLCKSKSVHLNRDIKLQSPLGAFATPTPYTARQHYFDPEQTKLYELHDGSFHIYTQISRRANSFQQTNQVDSNLPCYALFTLVKKFGHLCYYNASTSYLQQQVENEISHASNSDSTFKDYLLLQPKHIS
eukprot:2508188-Ditylum_brightwellii.AAC.1